jgi:dTDP-4-dehydrorhamnose reductase
MRTDRCRVLLTGSTGQLGLQLQRSRPAWVELIAPTRQQFNLEEPDKCRQVIQHYQPDWLINAAAFTAVDRAEEEVSRAYLVNAEAPAAMAKALAAGHGSMLQVSTDFVFSGRQGVPYRVESPVQPLNVYGSSKAYGERAILDLLATSGRGYVMRTSWLYGLHGYNFFRTMLRLHRERSISSNSLRVVADQIGCPTAVDSLARACWRLIQKSWQSHDADRDLGPIHHWCDAGVASWYDFAVSIGEYCVEAGWLEQSAQVQPIPASQYPTPAQRPAFSLLDCNATQAQLELMPMHWRQQLRDVIKSAGSIPTD